MSTTPPEITTPDTFGEPESRPSDAMTFINMLEAAPPAQPDKPRPAVRRLLQGDGGNLIVFTFSPGQSLPDHRAAHPITVSSLKGEILFGCGDETVTLRPGNIVHLKEHLTHRVDYPTGTDGDAILLLTMMTGERHG